MRTEPERCPTCGQTIPAPKAPRVRVCANCQRLIEQHHKWRYEQIGLEDGRTVTAVIHRHCDAPFDYSLSENHNV